MSRSILVLLFFLMQSANIPAMELVIENVDKWVEPELLKNKEKVTAVIKAQERAQIPCASDEDWGFSFSPSAFEYMAYSITRQKCEHSDARPMVVDLGAGLGFNSLNLALAGGIVNVVEMQRAAANLANSYIFTNLKAFKVAIDKENASSFYRVFPHDITKKYVNSWNKEKHYLALVSNLLHFLTPEQIEDLVDALYENLLPDGLILASADSPYIHQTYVDFYHAPDHQYPLFKGYAVYSKKRGRPGYTLEPVGLPIQVRKGMSAGKLYEGHYVSENNVQKLDSVYHTVKNYFTKEDLAAVFERKGFKISESFYINKAGNIVQNQEPRVGEFYRSCVVAIKPKD